MVLPVLCSCPVCHRAWPRSCSSKPLKMEGRDVLAGPKMTEYLTAVNKMAQFEWTLCDGGSGSHPS